MRSACLEARMLARRLDRRRFLELGSLGPLGLTLPVLLGAEAAAQPGSVGTLKHPHTQTPAHCILLWLTGGPSQLDTFDPKPDAPAEVRGPFQAIPTRVDGIRFAEPFARTAKHAGKLAVLRSVYHGLDHHVLAQGWMTAGRAHDAISYPPMGSVVARLHGSDPTLPPFVTVPRMALIVGFDETQHSQTAGALGAAYNPLVPDGTPGQPGFAVRDVGLPGGVGPARFARRARLLSSAGTTSQERAGSPSAAMQAVYQKAVDLIRSEKVLSAFSLDGEPAKLRDAYGRNGFGQSALLARRLVESGVRFVTVNWPSYYAWDHHGSIAGGIKGTGEVLDLALSGLLEDLSQRGMLERTLVLVMGEFGRTPKLNKDGGRDHWPHVMSVLMAGGGIRGGLAWGSSTPDGYPDERPLHARDMVATVYAALGIDPETELRTIDGRPIKVLADAEPVRELLR